MKEEKEPITLESIYLSGMPHTAQATFELLQFDGSYITIVEEVLPAFLNQDSFYSYNEMVLSSMRSMATRLKNAASHLESEADRLQSQLESA